MKKRTITVEVLDMPFLPGDEYIANRYPHDGVFQLADGRFFAKYGTTVADNPLSLRQWLAQAADLAHAAGVTCERAYDALSIKN